MTILVIGMVIEAVAFGALIFLLDRAHRKETADLHLRLASKDLSEFYYWRENFPLEVEHNREVLKKAREEKDETKELSPEELAQLRRAREF